MMGKSTARERVCTTGVEVNRKRDRERDSLAILSLEIENGDYAYIDKR